MNSVKKITGIALAVAAAGMFMTVAVPTASAHSAKVMCEGVNSCKGKGACKTANNGCKHQNACKGQGVLKLSQKKCDALKAKAAAAAEKEKK